MRKGPPFTSPVRILLIVLAAGLLISGGLAVYLTANEVGAAALITAGTALGVLAIVGPFVEAFSFGGFEAKMRGARAALDDASLRVEKQGRVFVSADDRMGALARAEVHADLLAAARVLWVDDEPGGNDAERNVLQAFGVTVDVAMDTEEAIHKLETKDYVCIISDMRRPESERAGEILLERARERGVQRWTIFYIMDLDTRRGAPAGALGITNRPDHLLHLVLDAVEREAFEPSPATRRT